jgi:hypothetical protein
VIVHEYPFNYVTHHYLRVFLKSFQIEFKLVLRNTIRSDCINIYEEERQTLYEMFGKFDCHRLTMSVIILILSLLSFVFLSYQLVACQLLVRSSSCKLRWSLECSALELLSLMSWFFYDDVCVYCCQWNQVVIT